MLIGDFYCITLTGKRPITCYIATLFLLPMLNYNYNICLIINYNIYLIITYIINNCQSCTLPITGYYNQLIYKAIADSK